MTKVLGVVGATLLFASTAFAADLPARAPLKAPPMIPIYNWTGFYIGGNLGGVWDTASVTDNFFGVSISDTRSGFIGGGQIGYNWQVSPQFVLGVEWMFDGTSLSSGFGPVPDGFGGVVSGNDKANWLTTVTGRIGYAANNWLFYAKGGGGWVHDDATITSVDAVGNVFTASGSDTRSGWVAGGGIEYGITPNWTVRVDYQHLGLTDRTIALPLFAVTDSVNFSRHLDMVTFGVNYKF